VSLYLQQVLAGEWRNQGSGLKSQQIIRTINPGQQFLVLAQDRHYNVNSHLFDYSLSKLPRFQSEGVAMLLTF
jgi:hypothetical protein